MNRLSLRRVIETDPVNFRDPKGLFSEETYCDAYPGDWTCAPLPIGLPGNDLQTVNSSANEQQSKGGGGTSTALSDQDMLDELRRGLKRAGDAISNNPDCAALLGGGPYPNPITVLSRISNSFTFGSINSQAGTVTSAITTATGQTSYGYVTVFTNVSIKLNNTSAGASLYRAM